MTRFNITLDQGIDLVNWSFENNLGGEIFVPKLRSFNILDLARAINSKPKFNYIGIRPGEKLHEELISESDSYNTLEGKNSYVILNNLDEKEICDKGDDGYQVFVLLSYDILAGKKLAMEQYMRNAKLKKLLRGSELQKEAEGEIDRVRNMNN